jgi:sugar phosphate permease
LCSAAIAVATTVAVLTVLFFSAILLHIMADSLPSSSQASSQVSSTSFSNVPPQRSRTGVFYGWITLGAIFLVYASGTIGVSTLPYLNAQLKDQFGWTHEDITLAPSLLFLMMSVLSLFAGAALQKLNPKRLLLIGWLCFVAALLLYSQVQTLWQFALVYVVYSIGSVCTGVIPGIYIIAKWFKHYRGIATGIFTVGSSFGGIIFPRFATYLLANGYSWQTTALFLVGGTIICAVVPWFFVRNYPEEVGETIDGRPSELQSPRDEDHVIVDAAVHDDDARLLPLLGSFTFYLILFITAAVWFCVTPMIQHLAFHMKDLRVDLNTAGTVSQVLFACSIIGKLAFGWVSSYSDKKIILLIATLCMAGGSFIVLLTTPENAHNVALLFTAAVVYGIGFSGSFTMVQLLVAEQYNKHAAFGKILGAVAMFDSLAGFVGIRLLGTLRTSLGNYTVAFTMLTVVGLCAALGVVVLKGREYMQNRRRLAVPL